MHELLAKILDTTILLILWYNGSPGVAKPEQFTFKNSTVKPESLAYQLSSIIINYFLNKSKIVDRLTGENNTLNGQLSSLVENRSAQSRSYYGAPGAPLIPAFDPISVLASLAFLAFLLQSFAALFDRTRSMIPTIVSSRQLKSDYNDQLTEVEKRVMRAIEEYATTSTDLLDKEIKNEKSF